MAGKAIVRIAFSGARREDFRRAERAARELLDLPEDWTAPRGWVWHHKGDDATLQLVPAEIHASAPHTGGFTQHPVPYQPRPWPAAEPLPLVDPGPPLSARQLDRAARRLGIPLPDSYRDLLLRHNGGRPRVRAFHGAEESEEALDVFFGIGGEDDLESWAGFYAGRLPQTLLPVARDAFGNLICVDREGSVFFWDHELEEANAPAVLMTNNLPTFLSRFFDDTSPAGLVL